MCKPILVSYQSYLGGGGGRWVCRASAYGCTGVYGYTGVHHTNCVTRVRGMDKVNTPWIKSTPG